jgi:hypothetical protein
MEIEKVNVTPAMAQEWLDLSNLSNRSISQHTVNKYSSDMKAGNWRDIHQNVIAFYDGGILADGQHRLSAVVRAGVEVEMFVATGLSKTDGSVIDQGRARSVSDALKIGGLVSIEKYHRHAVAIVKLIRHAEVGSIGTMTVKETADAVECIADAINYSSISLTGLAGNGLKSSITRAAVATAYCNMNINLVDRICRILTSGMPEGGNDAVIIRARNYMITHGANRGGPDRVKSYRVLLRAFHAYQKGTDIKILRVPSDNFMTMGIFHGK